MKPPLTRSSRKASTSGHIWRLLLLGAQLRRAFERAQRDGTLGYELEDRLEDWSQRASGAYWHLGRFDGGKALLANLETAGVEQKVIRNFQQRIDSVARRR